MAMKSCFYCGKVFHPDPRVGNRQKACCKACQRLRKQENNRLYRKKNPDDWKNHYEDYVKPWREKHPDYQRQWRRKKKEVQKGLTPAEIQAQRLSKAIELTEKTCLCLREIKAEIIAKPSLTASWVFQSL